MFVGLECVLKEEDFDGNLKQTAAKQTYENQDHHQEGNGDITSGKDSSNVLDLICICNRMGPRVIKDEFHMHFQSFHKIAQVITTRAI